MLEPENFTSDEDTPPDDVTYPVKLPNLYAMECVYAEAFLLTEIADTEPMFASVAPIEYARAICVSTFDAEAVTTPLTPSVSYVAEHARVFLPSSSWETSTVFEYSVWLPL